MNNFFIVTIFLPCDSLYLKKGEKRQWGGDRIQGGGKGVPTGGKTLLHLLWETGFSEYRNKGIAKVRSGHKKQARFCQSFISVSLAP